MKTMKKRTIRIIAATLATSAATALCVGVKLWTNADEGGTETPLSQSVVEGTDIGAESVLSYFTADTGVTLTANVDTPSYIAEKKNGLLVESIQNATLTYNTVIDVSELTKEDLLVEWQPMPSTLGVPEMTQMIVRLEDAEDPRYFINVSMHRYVYNDTALNRITHFLAQPNTSQDYYGWRYGKGMTNTFKLGTMVCAPWAGQKDGYSNGMKLYYDNEEHALYTALAPGEKSDFDTDGDRKLLIVDFDDPTHMGAAKSKHWTGFPSNKIKISFTPALLEASTAKYMIYGIDGQSFEGTLLNDSTPPKLMIDAEGYADNALPIGKIHKFYPFFSAQAVDKIYGEVPVQVRVLQNGEELYHTGTGFIPKQAGTYEIEYFAADRYGNETKKVYTVTVEDSISAMQCEIIETLGALDLRDESLKNADGHYPVNLYYPVKLPDMQVEGGSGKAKVQTIITYNGNEVKVTDNTFAPQNKGVYAVTYLATDYIGNTVGTTYTLEAAYTDVPLLIEPLLPDMVLIDRAVELPKVDSLYYTVWNQKVKAYDTITVYKEDKTTVLHEFDGSAPVTYTPASTDGNKVYVEYATAKEKGATSAKYGQEIVLQKSEKLSDRFLLADGITMTENNLSLAFTSTQEGASIRYINPLSVFDGLSLEFSVPKEANGYNEVRITFTDYVDKTIQQTVSVYKNPTENARTSYIAINGDRSTNSEITASFYGNVITNFLFTLNQDGSVNHSDLGVEKPSTAFKGFPSGYVYMEISLHGLEENKEATVTLQALKNQIMGAFNRDFIKPIIYITNEPVGITTLGSWVEIPAVYASDVYDRQVNVSVKVTFGDKVVYSAENNFGKLEASKIAATNYGTYSLIYEARDASGNSVTRKYSVRVRDNVAPTLTVDGDVPTSVKAGETLKFPNVYANDNVDAELTVYAVIIDPMNGYHLLTLEEEYVVKMKGRYVICFYCSDVSANQTYSQNYYFTVE